MSIGAAMAKILVIDDEPQWTAAAKRQLQSQLTGGLNITKASTVENALKVVGTKKLLEDFQRYGFGERTDLSQDGKFWSELAPIWKMRLIPAPAYVSLSDEINDTAWAEALSIGEANIKVTALHVSRFLQAVGNNGVMWRPSAKEEQSTHSAPKPPMLHQELKNSIRVMGQDTALRLQSAMRDTVERGTAKSIAKALEDTGWQVGGKTGSGMALLPKGAQIDGWFAGLIFDPQGRARFTVVTFVRSGGYGGENAAKILAELARYIIGEKTTVSR